jgi:predicted nuclease of predicted toxin-antitoxin system
VAKRRKSSSTEPRVKPYQFNLIDENLTPGLVKFARSRGFLASHVNDVDLRTASDKAVAQHALKHEMIVVTNNMVDFRKLYARRKLHPGLVFVSATDEQTFTRENQAALFNVALDEILATDILQEVLLVNLVAEDEEGEIEYEITRHELPKH